MNCDPAAGTDSSSSVREQVKCNWDAFAAFSRGGATTGWDEDCTGALEVEVITGAIGVEEGPGPFEA